MCSANKSNKKRNMSFLRFFENTLLFLAVFLFLFVCSCSETDNGANDAGLDFALDNGNMDFDGKEFRIRFYEYFNLAENSIFAYKEDTTFYDAALKRIREVEDICKCKITTENSSDAELGIDFTGSMFSGLYYTDAIMSCSYNLRTSEEAGMFESILAVSDIVDYTDSVKWGNWKILEQNVWKGDLYGVCPVQWPDFYISNSFCFAFNEKFAQQYGHKDPREDVENGTWNRAAYEQLMRDYCMDDSGTEKIYAVAWHPGHFLDMSLRANNAQVYKFVDGGYVSGYHTEEGRNALEWAHGIISDYKDYIYPDAGDSGNYQAFIDEKTPLLLSYTSYIYGSRANVSYSIDEYCALPVPNGPEREKNNESYTGFLECTKNTLLFPLNSDLEASAYVFNRIFEPLDGLGADELRDYYLKNYFHSPGDLDVLLEIISNARYAFCCDGLRQPVVEKLYDSRASVTKVLEENKEVQNRLVQNYLVQTAMYINDIFGDVQ